MVNINISRKYNNFFSENQKLTKRETPSTSLNFFHLEEETFLPYLRYNS